MFNLHHLLYLLCSSITVTYMVSTIIPAGSDISLQANIAGVDDVCCWAVQILVKIPTLGMFRGDLGSLILLMRWLLRISRI